MKISTELMDSVKQNYLGRPRKEQVLIRWFIMIDLKSRESLVTESLVLASTQVQLKLSVSPLQRAFLIDALVIIHYASLIMKEQQIVVSQVFDNIIKASLENQSVVDQLATLEKIGIL